MQFYTDALGSQGSSPPGKDLFSAQSKEYASSRPTYPRGLFHFIVGLVDEKNLAWDCATGNGQAAVILADYFKEVVASDISVRQLEYAQQKSNIVYQIFHAESTPLEDNSVDLITVAQALHWFDFDRFYCEARRVLRKRKDAKTSRGGILAAWAYGLHTISHAVDDVTHKLYEDILGDKYWPRRESMLRTDMKRYPFPLSKFQRLNFKYS